MAKKKVQVQGAQNPRNEVWFAYSAVTRDEAQHRNWTFYKAIIIFDQNEKIAC